LNGEEKIYIVHIVETPATIPELPVGGKSESKSSDVPLTAANERQT
jgi:hypothetical protein